MNGWQKEGLDALGLAIVERAILDYVQGTPEDHNASVAFFRDKDWFATVTGDRLDGEALLMRLQERFPDIPCGLIEYDSHTKKKQAWSKLYQRQRREKLDAEGRCRDCGRKLTDSELERFGHYCEHCGSWRRARAKQQYEKKRAAKDILKR